MSNLDNHIHSWRDVLSQFFDAYFVLRYSTLAYAVAELGVNHVIVLGHYGCGGVKAAMSPSPEPPIDAAQGVVQAWIEPIRELHRNSVRRVCEIRVDLREIIYHLTVGLKFKPSARNMQLVLLAMVHVMVSHTSSIIICTLQVPLLINQIIQLVFGHW